MDSVYPAALEILTFGFALGRSSAVGIARCHFSLATLTGYGAWTEKKGFGTYFAGSMKLIVEILHRYVAAGAQCPLQVSSKTMHLYGWDPHIGRLLLRLTKSAILLPCFLDSPGCWLFSDEPVGIDRFIPRWHWILPFPAPLTSRDLQGFAAHSRR